MSFVAEKQNGKLKVFFFGEIGSDPIKLRRKTLSLWESQDSPSIPTPNFLMTSITRKRTPS